jgi:hypothetical protein
MQLVHDGLQLRIQLLNLHSRRCVEEIFRNGLINVGQDAVQFRTQVKNDGPISLQRVKLDLS